VFVPKSGPIFEHRQASIDYLMGHGGSEAVIDGL